MAINILDSMIINRISAGEVVESPFSIVKELIDNSIDAGSDKISIEILNGGIDKIIVKDNGKGIDYEDIKKAFLPHATSKIKDLSDLEAITTLGFRGEALASISNVSQTILTTKTKDTDCAYYLEVDGGKFGSITATTSDDGTKIEVNNLFFNTPARRKFLKKPKQEENKITDIVSRYILAHPNINFKYIANGKVVYQTNGNTILDAIYCVYGAEITQNMMPVQKSINNINLTGYVSKVGFSKPNTSYQTLIINNRYVVDEIVSKAVYMANEEYLMTRQFPIYVLYLTMPATDLDVNVHPSKINVKFENPSKIYDLVYSAVRSSIYNALTPNIPVEEDKNKESSQDYNKNLIKTDLNSLKEIEIDVSDSPFKEKTSQLRQESYTPITMFDLNKSASKISENKLKTSDIKTEHKVENISLLNNNINNIKTTSSVDGNKNTQYKQIEDFADFKIVGQLFNEFIVLEKDNNMLLIDFHAGHERLNYDKFTQMVNSRQVVVQDLLVPYTQEMTPVEVDFILSLKDELYALGFDIDSFGDKKIIINSVPLQLKDINLKTFIDDMLHDMKNLRPNMNNEIRHYLMQKACKSSVRAGMTLSEMEIKELLKNLDIKHPVLLCPHGRPVVTVISKDQIEKWFKRIV